MKLQIKNILLVILTAAVLIACHKDKELQFPPFIVAGQTDGVGIKYVDFEPDKELEVFADYYKSHILLDLNNDSIDDFELIYAFPPGMSSTSDRYSYILPMENSAVCVSANNESALVFAEALESSDTISNKCNWANTKTYLYTYHHYSTTLPGGTPYSAESHQGDWYDGDNIFVGVKIVKDNNEIFGWIDVKPKGKEVRRYAVTCLY